MGDRRDVWKKGWLKIVMAVFLCQALLLCRGETFLFVKAEDTVESQSETVLDSGEEETEETAEQNVQTVSVAGRNAGVDLVLVLDHSVSIRNKDAALAARDGGARTVAALAAGTDSRMGVVYFTGSYVDPQCEAAVQYPEYIDNGKQFYKSSMFSLNSPKDRTYLMEEVIGKGYEGISGKSTNIGKGLNAALEMLDTPNGSEKVILLFCDGKNDTKNDIEAVEAQYDEETKNAVAEAKEKGIKIYCVYSSDNNEKQSDTQALKQIVNYYEEPGNYSDRFVEQTDDKTLQECFLNVFQEITGTRYTAVKTASDGSCTISLPDTDVQALNLVFQGDHIQITDVTRDDASLPESYSNGGDTACVFLDGLKTGSTYRVYTNASDETGYLMYNHGVGIYGVELSDQGEITKGAKVSLRINLYDHNGNLMVPDSYETLDVTYVNGKTRETVSVAKGLSPTGDHFETDTFQIPSDGEYSYRITLSYGTELIGTCTWMGGNILNEDVVMENHDIQVIFPRDFVSDGEKTAQIIPLTELCRDPEGLYDLLEYSFMDQEGKEVTWLSLDLENKNIAVTPKAMGFYHLMPLRTEKVQFTVKDINGNVSSSMLSFLFINTRGIRILAVGTGTILLLLIIAIGAWKRYSKRMKRMVDIICREWTVESMAETLSEYKNKYDQKIKLYLEDLQKLQNELAGLMKEKTGVSLQSNQEGEIDKRNMTEEESDLYSMFERLEEMKDLSLDSEDDLKKDSGKAASSYEDVTDYEQRIKEFKKNYQVSWITWKDRKKYGKAYKEYQKAKKDYDLIEGLGNELLKGTKKYDQKLENIKTECDKIIKNQKQNNRPFQYSLLVKKADETIVAYRSCFEKDLSRRKKPFSLLDDMETNQGMTLRQYLKRSLYGDPVCEDRIMIYAEEDGLVWKSFGEDYATGKQGSQGRILFRNTKDGAITAFLAPEIDYEILFGEETWYLHVCNKNI